MDGFLHENHRGGPTMTLLNMISVLGVLNLLNLLNMPKEASLACWALLWKTHWLHNSFQHANFYTASFVSKLLLWEKRDHSKIGGQIQQVHLQKPQTLLSLNWLVKPKSRIQSWKLPKNPHSAIKTNTQFSVISLFYFVFSSSCPFCIGNFFFFFFQRIKEKENFVCFSIFPWSMIWELFILFSKTFLLCAFLAK